MEELLNYLIYSAGILGVFCLIYHFLLRRLTFFQLNRWFLVTGIIASLNLPLVEIEQTVYVERPELATTDIPLEYLLMAQNLDPEPAVMKEEKISLAEFLLYAYIAIALVFLGKMVIELLSLYRCIRSGRKLKKERFTHVLLNENGASQPIAPFSFFNYICYSPQQHDTAELELILNHERVHARQYHSIDLLASHVYRAVFWVNPLAWLLKQQIGENLEFIADAQASKRNVTDLSYERALLSSAAGHLQPALANNFFTPFIKKRILMLQQQASKKWQVYKYAFVLPVIVLFLYSFNVVERVEWVEKEPASAKSETGESTSAGITDEKVTDELTSQSLVLSDSDDEDSAFAKAEQQQNPEVLFVKILATTTQEGPGLKSQIICRGRDNVENNQSKIQK